ncbi:MAG: NAD-dependent epimerase/dehydratase family protein [Pirellulales bacterium]
MRIVVTGGCGFVGSALARRLIEWLPGVRVTVFDNLRRAGAETNRDQLRRLGIDVVHGDARCRSDIDALPACNWFIDAAAEPSVLAGTAAAGGRGTTSRQLVEHNLWGTVNLLEAAAERRAGFVMLSTSRVYAIEPLARLPLVETSTAFRLDAAATLPIGAGPAGISEAFATAGPVSLYGATKLASEALAIEYAAQSGTPLFINRCGVMAGAGQFGRADQGIFSWWIHSWAGRRPLRYIGFGGRGLQVRDCLHPDDLARLITTQLATTTTGPQPIVNVSGGIASATSLAELSAWCAERFGPHDVAADLTPRPHDIPWLLLDHTQASQAHAWQPAHDRFTIFEEIACHAEANPDWLDRVAS